MPATPRKAAGWTSGEVWAYAPPPMPVNARKSWRVGVGLACLWGYRTTRSDGRAGLKVVVPSGKVTG